MNAYARAASSPAVTDAASAASWAPARYHWTASCEAAAPGRSASASRDRAVQALALGRQQLAVDHLAHEGVAEADPPVVGLPHQDPRLEPGAQGARQLALRNELVQEVEADPAAGRGDEPQEPDGRLVEPPGAQQQGLGDAPRNVPALLGREQLFEEERVPAGARVQIGDQRRRQRAPGDHLELPRRVGRRQGLELDARDHGPADQLGHERPQRVVGQQLLGAVRDGNGDPLGAQVAREERQQVARRAVRPVQVLERDQDGRALGREAREQPQQDLVQPRLPERAPGPGAGRRRSGGHRVGQQDVERLARLGGDGPVLGQPAQRRGDRCVRELLAAELDAFAVQHEEPARPRLGLERLQQARLADAGLAGHQRDPRASRGRLGQAFLQGAELLLAPEHDSARDPRAQRAALSIARRSPSFFSGFRTILAA